MTPVVPPVSAPEPATAGPQRVLLLNSFGREFEPYSAVASSFRDELARISPRPVEFLEVSLETIRLETADERPVVDYVRALCASRRVDLVVAVGQPAARFWLGHRDGLMPGVPIILAGAEERHLDRLPLVSGDGVVSIRIDVPGLLRHILEVVPETTEVVVILGNSPTERYWVSEFGREWQPFERRVRLTWLNEVPFEEVLRRAAALPPRAAIFFGLMLVDAAGVPHEQEVAFDKLRAAATAPIFGWSDNLLGRGLVGGPLIPLPEVGRESARAARRVLAGEPPETIGRSVLGATRPAYDWRELRRWNIEADRLPRDRTILFRPRSIVREYRWAILASLGIIAAQAAAIAALLVARRRRRQAEEETLRLRRELAHAGRISVVGQLASSLAHELNQPLGAILRNAEAAELFLDATPPNLEEVRAILADIRKDDHRAGEVIDGVRSLVRRHDMKMAPVAPEAIVDAVTALVRPDARSRGVTLVIEVPPGLPKVRGNPVQLQQVLLNLVINGMEAMDQSPDGRKTLAVSARPIDAGLIELAVRDSGPGIPPDELSRIFDNFYTTKAGGMGMGLSICRRIVEAHGGRIAAENEAGGGATLRVTLPVAEGRR